MTTFQKLKHEARRAEQRSDWARAIDLYQRALATDEDMADLSLYNRIGDLHLRLGQNEAAVECYERAVERYADNGMHTSAIALCNKILRIAPGRTSVYRRLAALHARTGLVVEGRGSLLSFVDGMLEQGRTEDALEAVREFAEQTGDEEIQLQLADRLLKRGERDAALGRLRAVHRQRSRRGADTAELRRRIEELAPDDADVDAAEDAGAAVARPETPARLAALVAERLAADGRDTTFSVEATPPGEEPDRAADEKLAGIRRELDRFRRHVQHALEDADPTLHYDLGVEFMTIGLLEEAVREFQAAVVDPRLVEAANARIGECLALRSAGSSFEAIRAASRRVEAGNGAAGPPAAAPPDRPEGPRPAGAREEDGPPGAAPDEPTGDARPAATEPSAEPSRAQDDGEDDELQGHFFRARLAQYRIRRAEERHMTDHAAHLDLGTAYVEMELHQEALRELGVALSGPRPISGRAARALKKLALAPRVPPELALEVVERLAAAGAAAAAEALGTRLAGDWGQDHPMIDELVELRSRLWEGVDELPALEDMFPALGEHPPVDGGEAAEDAGDRTADAASPEAPPESGRNAEPAAGAPTAESRAEAAEAEAGVDADVGASAGSSETAESGDLAERALARADELLAAGEAEQASDRLHQAFLRLEEEHRTRDALAVLDRLLELQPDDSTLHHQRTELAVMVNDRDRLLQAHAALAECLLRLDANPRARAAYGRMLDIDPSNETARRAIAEIDAAGLEEERRRGAGRSSAESDGVMEEVVEGELTEAEAAELEALIEGLEGDEELEMLPAGPDGEDLEEPEDVTARSRYELGLAFRQMGMWEEAVRELRPALHGVTDRLGALEALGECLLKSGRPEEAVDLLRSTLRTDGDSAQVGPLYVLGLSLQAEGDVEAAREVLARVEAAQPGYRDTAERLSELSL